MRPRHARTALAVLLSAAGAAQAAPSVADDTRKAIEKPMEEITVVGTRTERTLDQIDATISVFDREDIDRRLFRDIQDLVRYEPGVSVGGTGSRFGLEGFTIRGIGGNRVLALVDGIRIPEEFSFGPFLSSRRDFVDVDAIERVEIARGPVSTLYGSDALGGVVAVTTRAPNDYVSNADPLHLEGKAGYSSEDDSIVSSFTGAFGNDRIAALVNYVRREAKETETAGGNGGTGPDRAEADPQDIDTDTIGLKLSARPWEHHTVIFGFERFASAVDTNILSDAGTVARGTLTNSRNTQDDRKRERFSLAWRFDNPEGLINNAMITAYRQESDTEQFTFDTRTPPRNSLQNRTRNSVFAQEIDGLFGQVGSTLDFAGVSHTITAGIDFYETNNASLRDGGDFDAETGAFIPPSPFAPPLPARDFPLTKVKNQAFFLQDELVMLGGRLRVTPGFRYDDYTADVETDALFQNGNPGQEVTDYDDNELTLKLGALYQFSDAVSAWARYSEGFRAPPYDDVNVGFTNFAGNYKTIAATDLSAETSEGFELGLRLHGSWGEAQFAAYRTRFDNFIESLAVAPAFLSTGGIDPADGLLTFQSVNRDEVVIEGFEARGRFLGSALGEAFAAFQLETALAWSEGEDADEVPVNTVDPFSAVLGLRWAPANARYDAELVWTFADGKDDNDIQPGTRITTSRFHVLDLLCNVDITDRVSVDAGVFNLLDESYIRWQDTAGIGLNEAGQPADNPARFTRPGRNFSVTLRAIL